MNFRRICCLLATLGWLTSVVVQTGNLSTVDATRRLQVTRSFWTNEPQVLPSDFPDFGIVGRQGKPYAWYGIGQSLVMLPGDILGNIAAKATNSNPQTRQQIAAIILCYLTFPLISAAIAVTAFLFLESLGWFTRWESCLGVLALLWGTSLLNFTQTHQENDLLLLSTLVALLQGMKWSRTRSGGALAWASAAVGFSILIRLPAILSAGAVMVVVATSLLGLIHREHFDPKRILGERMRQMACITIPIMLVFVLIDRGYQVYRFGWSNALTTYFGIYYKQICQLHPGTPQGYPYTNPFFSGFVGVFTAPDASVFLYDPLIVLSILGAIFCWRRLPPVCKAVLLSFGALLLCLAAFHARLDFWSGQTSWGDRYTTVPVEILAMMGTVICLKVIFDLHAAGLRFLFFGFVGACIALQVSSLIFTVNLERSQALDEHRVPWTSVERITNLAKVIGHEPLVAGHDDFGKEMSYMKECILLPFRSSTKLPTSIAKVVKVFWMVALIALLINVLLLFRGANNLDRLANMQV